jgi:glutaredoxin 3
MGTETIVWSKENCPYCIKAKHMLKAKGIRYEERSLSDGSWSREQLLEAVPNARTVPQIWLHGKYVGGYTELEQYFEDHDMWIN